MKKLLLVGFLTLVASSAHAAVTLLDHDQWKVSMGGFVEFDTIVDSTRSFTEVPGNGAVSRDSVAGQTGRTQMSIRNTRLAFTVEAPEMDGWKSKGYIEGDFMGYDPSPATSSSSPAQTEAGFFNNPTLRIRHAYLAADSNGWQLQGGQYWDLFGWQPYYFLPSIEVSPIAGMLYGRTAQARVTKTVDLGSKDTVQAAIGVMRPPQRDASLPGLEGGLRLALGERTAGFTGGGTGAQKTQPMSIGVTGLVREFVIPQHPDNPTQDVTHTPGTAVAVDALLPVLASADGKDVSNTLVIGGEFTRGTGYGDQFTSWTGGQASPLASGSAATTFEKSVNLDGGIGDFDPNGNFSLVDITTFNAYFQYHLPSEWRTFFSGGYGRLYSDNADLYTLAGKTTTGGGSVPYNRDEVYFLNVAHDFTKQLRVGFEFAQTRTRYADNYIAHNNRYQVTAYFAF